MLHVALVTPEKLIAEADTSMVTIPGSDGDMGLLPEHAPVISGLRTGAIEFFEGEQKTASYFVQAGFCEVSNNNCTILAEEAEDLEGITPEIAQNRLQQAKDELEVGQFSDHKSTLEQRCHFLESLVMFLSEKK